MPFPPQQADEHCKGTGQGELKLKLKLKLSWNWIRITLISCNHFEFNAKVCKHELQEIENCPDCYLNAHVKVNPMEKNTRSFWHCQNYYINRKDLSLSLWSNDHNGELFRKTPGSQRLAGSPILWYGPGNLSWILFYHYDHYHYGPRNHSIIHLTLIYFVTIAMHLPKFFYYK